MPYRTKILWVMRQVTRLQPQNLCAIAVELQLRGDFGAELDLGFLGVDDKTARAS